MSVEPIPLREFRFLDCESELALLEAFVHLDPLSGSMGVRVVPRLVRPIPGPLPAEASCDPPLEGQLTEALSLVAEMTAGASSVCVAFCEDSAAMLGAVHAVAAGKRLVVVPKTRGELTLKGTRIDGSITFVASAHFCRDSGWGFFSHLVTSATDRPAHSTSWGVISGSTASSIADYICRLAYHKVGVHHSQNGALGFHVGHGRSYCAVGGRLCTSSDFETNTACSPDFDCALPAKPPRAADGTSDMIVIESCCVSSFMHAGPSGSALRNVASHLLAGGAKAVVAPYNTQIANKLTSVIARGLTSLGYSAGAIAAALNSVGLYQNDEGYDYVVLGDPDAHLECKREPDKAVCNQVSIGKWHIISKNPVSEMGVFVCHDSSLLTAARLSLHLCSGQSDVALLREPGRLLIFVPPATGLDVELTSDPPLNLSDVEAASHLVQTARYSDQHHELERLIRVVKVGVLSSLGGDTQSATIYSHLKGLRRDIEVCSVELAQRIVGAYAVSGNEGFWLFRHFAETQGARFHKSPIEALGCPNCDLRLRIRPYTVGVWPKEERNLLECERCMLVADYPVGEAPMYLHVPKLVRRGTPVPVNMGVHEKSGRLYGCAALAVDLLDHSADLLTIRPWISDGVWNPTTSNVEFRFDLTLGFPLPRHLYNLHGIAIKGGRLFWAQGRVVLTS